MTRWRSTLWLLAAVSLMGAFMIIFERQQPAPARRLALDDAALDVGSAPVRALVVWQGTSVVECVERGGVWYLDGAAPTRAAGPLIRHLLEGVRSTRIRERVTPAQMAARGLDRASYGLERPRARISILAGGATRELLLGSDTPLGDLVFAQANGDRHVLTVTRDAIDALPNRAEAWQAATVMPETILAARRLEIKQPGGFVQLAIKDGTWRLQQPRSANASDAVVEKLLEQLQQLRVESLGPAVTGIDLVAYGLAADDNPLQVTVWSDGDDAAGVTLMLGKPVQESPGLVYGRVSDMATLCRLPQSAVTLLSVKAEDVRDRRMCPVNPAEIMAIRLQDADRRLELERGGDGWRIQDPVRGRADTLAVSRFLRSFGSLESIAFPENTTTNPLAGDAAGLRIVLSDHPLPAAGSNGVAEARSQGTWTYHLPAAATNATANVYCEEQQALYHLRSQDLARLTRASGGAPRAVTDPLVYLDRTILELPAASVRRVTLAYRGREEAVVRDAAGSWAAESPPEARVQDEAVAGIMRAVANLRALRVETLSATNWAAYGLDDESTTRLTFSLGGEAGLQKTLILATNTVAGGVHAAVQGQDTVFLVAPEIAAQLTRSVVSWQ